ncbi:hypothetical protein BJY00DRAFT_316105 [Aspergillus carlsbadensis]|nr:hypothetical protein BJY00DRAFT_316105 [Aspergillus carlsbadensis]
MSILTPQDSFDTVLDEFIMATTEASPAQNTANTAQSQTLCTCTHNFPPEPAVNILSEEEELRVPRGRRRRIPYRNRSRDFSPRFSPRSPAYSPGPARDEETLEVVSSHTELFTPAPGAAAQAQATTAAPIDRIVLLTPFTRPAYITTHPASHYDFTRWLPLLALGVPETWYMFSNTDTLISTSLNQPHLAPATTSLKPLQDPRPVGLRLPRIAANDPLHPPHSTASLTPIKSDSGPLPPPDLIYFSIQSSITGHTTNRSGRWVSPDRGMMPDLAGPGAGTTGATIYRVVRCGSREEAAAQAFYAAGGNRWSTLFTCVVVGGKRVLSQRVLVADGEGYERVQSLGELVEDGEGNRKIRVFY